MRRSLPQRVSFDFNIKTFDIAYSASFRIICRSKQSQVFNMHPHLHTKDNQGQLSHWPFFVHELTFLSACEEVMAILDECHARGFMWKAMGMCNTAKTDVNKCLRAQRLERTKANREAAKIKTEKRKAMFAEIDQNS
jgi:COX assembly protein 2